MSQTENRFPRLVCGLCKTMLRGLEKKAPEEQDAEDNQDSNNDDLNETHCHFPRKETY